MVALARCEYCGRTFLPEKLIIHNRSCTAEKPARAVNDPVNRRSSFSSSSSHSSSAEVVLPPPPLTPLPLQPKSRRAPRSTTTRMSLGADANDRDMIKMNDNGNSDNEYSPEYQGEILNNKSISRPSSSSSRSAKSSAVVQVSLK